MVDTPAIRARLARGAVDFEPLEAVADPETFLRSAAAASGPTVYLFPNSALSVFMGLDDVVLDRGTKNPTKSLSRLLLGYERMPAIRGSYSSPGQLTRSVRTLLENARAVQDDNVFLIGTDEDVFDEIWGRISDSPPVGDPARPHRHKPPSGAASDTRGAAPGAGLGPGRRRERSLVDLLPRRSVPVAVRRRFVGDSASAELVRQLALRAAAHEEPVLVLGDTGTGKEVVARIIHDQSPRAKRTFVPVNCGAIPRELLESELFGAEPGAYTDLKRRKTGLWRTAQGGTLFLDEIADLALDHQVKILRALEERAVRPLGGEKPIDVDVRIIAATNRDLYSLMGGGEFREDLYYRLRSFLIRTPPLRDHPEDIRSLADVFWKRITRDAAAVLPDGIVRELEAYRWPGNARELKMVLSSLHALFGRDVKREHLVAIFEFEGHAHAGVGSSVPLPGRAGAVPEALPAHRVECLRHLRAVDEVLRAWEVALAPALGAEEARPGVRSAPSRRARGPPPASAPVRRRPGLHDGRAHQERDHPAARTAR